MRTPTLCLVTDRHLCGPERLVQAVTQAVEGGVNMVQLREKDLPARDLYELGRQLLAAIGDRCPLIVSDRLDVALALNAAGVQIGAAGLPLAEARRLAGRHLLLGASVHSVAETKAAAAAGADFAVLGTIYATRSHPGKPPDGPALIAAARQGTRLPLIAIGGIDATKVDEVMAAGADGVAVISAILGADDPRAAAAELAAAVRDGWRYSRSKE